MRPRRPLFLHTSTPDSRLRENDEMQISPEFIPNLFRDGDNDKIPALRPGILNCYLRVSFASDIFSSRTLLSGR